MTTELYYFSGTGNSRYAAQELANRLPDCTLIPIVHRLNEKDFTINGDVVGFVFPLHGMTLPIPVQFLLRKAVFTNENPYIFGVTTRAGSKVYAFQKLAQLLKRKKQILNTSIILTMWNNDPKLKEYEDPSEKDISAMRENVSSQMDALINLIKNREDSLAVDTNFVTFDLPQPLTWLMEHLILAAMWMNTWLKVKDYFSADEKCIHCGVCEKVCLSNKIKLVDGKPTWDDSMQCYLCYTCLNYCPSHAIQINDKVYMKSFTPVKGRYPHPFANAKEIAEQKN